MKKSTEIYCIAKPVTEIEGEKKPITIEFEKINEENFEISLLWQEAIGNLVAERTPLQAYLRTARLTAPFPDLKTDKQTKISLVARRENEAIGYIDGLATAYDINKKEEPPVWARLNGFAIRPDHQGYGLGNLLMSTFLTTAIGHRALKMFLVPYKRSKTAHCFYQNLGAKPCSVDEDNIVDGYVFSNIKSANEKLKRKLKHQRFFRLEY